MTANELEAGTVFESPDYGTCLAMGNGDQDFDDNRTTHVAVLKDGGRPSAPPWLLISSTQDILVSAILGKLNLQGAP